jgi:O-antigen ligase
MAFVVSVWTTIETFSGVRRPSGPIANPNLYADYLLFSLFMLILVVDREIDTNRYYRAVFLLVPLPFILISLLSTQSRSGIGALLVGIFVLASTNWRLMFKILQKKEYFVSSAGVLFGFVLLLFSRRWGIISRFQSLTAGEGTGGRFDRWYQFIDVIVDSYFIGVGWGQHQQYIESEVFLHNSLVQVTVELGIIGAIVLILIWLLVARRGLQLSMTRRYSYAIYLIAFLSATVANSMFHNNLNFRTFWITLGLIGALEIDYWEYYNESGREYLEDI